MGLKKIVSTIAENRNKHFALKKSRNLKPKSIINQKRINLHKEIDLYLKENSQKEIEEFGKKAQALLGGYEYNSLTKITEHKTLKTIEDFVQSKPSSNSRGLSIYSYKPNKAESDSKYEEVWFKLKSPEGIDEVLSIPKSRNRASSENILKLALLEAKKLVPDAAAIVKKKGYFFSFNHKNMLVGFRWVSSSVDIHTKKKTIEITTPTLITHSNIPTLGGMNYCKVLTPSSMARLLIDIAYSN